MVKCPYRVKAKGSGSLAQERNFLTYSEDRKMSDQRREKVGKEKIQRRRRVWILLSRRWDI